jgi:hypothetical protein
MAKIRLTESQLNQIVAESVKRVLREGELWDAMKSAYQTGRDEDDFDDITNQEFKNYIRGGNIEGRDETNYEDYRKSRDNYKRSEKGSFERRNAAHDAVAQRPGLVGRLGRGATMRAARVGQSLRHAKNFMNNKIGF